MLQPITSSYKEHYQRDGIVFPVPVLSPGEVRHYRSFFKKIEAHYDGYLPRAGWLHLFFEEPFKLVAHPTILDVVRDIIGPDIIVQSSLFIIKYPNSDAYFPWHQDGRHSRLDPSKSTSVWLAFSDSNVENGCMRVIPRSHAGPWLEHVNLTNSTSMLKNGGQIIQELDESKARHVVLKPGEISAHQNNIIHGSLPNSSSFNRVGFIIRYTTPEYQAATPVIRVSGDHPCEHLHVVTRPWLRPGEDAYKKHKDWLEKRGEILGTLT